MKQPSLRKAVQGSLVATIDPEYRIKLLKQEAKVNQSKVDTIATWAHVRILISERAAEVNAKFAGAPPAYWQESQESINRVFDAVGGLVVKDAEVAQTRINTLQAQAAQLRAQLEQAQRQQRPQRQHQPQQQLQAQPQQAQQAQQ